MVSAITNFLTSPTLTNISQSTTSAVSIETAMKAVGRPSFILADDEIDDKTKRYAATKEFLYQATCLATYMALVIPFFKYGSFRVAKKYIMQDEAGFQKFKNAKEFLNYRKLAEMSKQARTEALKDKKYTDSFTKELKNELLSNDKPEQFHVVKGAIEFGNTIGSVLGLAIFAPEVSHLIVHPIMKFMGIEKKHS